MPVTGKIAFSAAQARCITGRSARQKIKFFVDGARTFTVELLFAVEDRLAVGIVFQEFFRHERIGLVSAPVVNRALPCVYIAVRFDGVSGTRFRAFSASVAELSVKRRVACQRGIGHDEHKADERPELRCDDVAFHADGAEPADFRRPGEIHDDVRYGFSGSDRFGVRQFIGVDQFRGWWCDRL